MLSPDVEIISFDIFDTLIWRPALSPSDLFDIIAGIVQKELHDPLFNFKEMRIETERYVRSRSVEDEITFDQITQAYQDIYGLEPAVVKKLRDTEVRVEKSLISTRPSGYRLFQFALSTQKPVYLVSDMYLPKAVVEDILASSGISGHAALYLSSDKLKTKKSGALYVDLIKKTHSAPEKIIHFGDNKQTDIKSASQVGIQAYHLPKISDVFFEYSGNVKVWQRHIKDIEPGARLALGLVAQKYEPFIFDNRNRNSQFNGSAGLLGYYAVGMLVLGLTRWVLNEAKRDGFTDVYFLARDGKLPIEAYRILSEVIKDAPTPHYLQASRRVCFPLAVTNKSELLQCTNWSSKSNNTTIRQLLEKDIGLPITEERLGYIKSKGYYDIDRAPNNFPTLLTDLSELHSEILNTLEAKREDTLAYYRSEIKDFSSSVLFDVGYRARMQRVLGKHSDSPVNAYYLFSYSEAESVYFKDGTSKNFLFPPTNRSYIREQYLTAILEILISDNAIGSLTGIAKSENGGFTFEHAEEELTSESRKVLSDIQSSSLQFVTDFTQTFGEYFDYVNFFPGTAIRFLEHFMSSPEAIDAKILDGIVFSNGPSEDFAFLGNGDHSYWKKGEKAISCQTNQTKSLPVKIAISKSEIKWFGDKGRLSMSGWCLTPEENFSITLSDQNGAELYTLRNTGAERRDVRKHHPDYCDAFAGWELKLDVSKNMAPTYVSATYTSADIKTKTRKKEVLKHTPVGSKGKGWALPLKKQREHAVRDAQSQYEDCVNNVRNRERWQSSLQSHPSAKKIMYLLMRPNAQINPYGPGLNKLARRDDAALTTFVSFGSADSDYDFGVEYERLPEVANLQTVQPPIKFTPKEIERKLQASHPALKEACDAQCVKWGFSWESAATRAILASDAFKEVLEFYQPDHLVIFSPKSVLARSYIAAAQALQIPYSGIEAGVLPGTLMVDIKGHMGESWIAQDADYFKSLPVSFLDLWKSQKYIRRVKRKNISRRPTVKIGRVKALGKRLKEQKKSVILYVGSNDVDSGHFPYKGTNKTHNSPFYPNSVEALNHLVEVCREFPDIHILAKHHPSMGRMPGYFDAEDTENVTFLGKDDSIQDCLSISDMCATILSQSAYEALIRKIPVLMLGRNQISGKDCAYELKSHDALRSLVVEAKENGLTKKMHSNFVKHTAQLMKYSAYDSSALGIGRDLKSLTADLLSILNGTYAAHLEYEFQALKAKFIDNA
jgi:FMN phosphatase YigB (HAD superfamily)